MDVPLARDDHVLRLYEASNVWTLVMHTMDRRFATGITTWQGTQFGLSCVRR